MTEDSMRKKKQFKMISVYPSTYERLKALGKMGESFDSVITRLLNALDKVSEY